jgi:hypothetical protein
VSSALIGYTGFVGGFLAEREAYDLRVNRANLEELRDGAFERVVCAGLPAAKWLANQAPQEDHANMRRLCAVLGTVRAQRFVLISTIDVYPRTHDADEGFDCGQLTNHAYGRHRLEFENFVRERFPHALIVRLPALFGPGLRKNILFDLRNGNQLERINPASRFQWYPLERLPDDVRRAEAAGLTLVNLFPEPLPTRLILERFYPHARVGALEPQAAADYDLHTRHAAVFGGAGHYCMPASAVLVDLATFCGAAA